MKEKKKKKHQPTTVTRVFCGGGCGELMVKIYPWSSITIRGDLHPPKCKRCLNRNTGGLLAQLKKNWNG